jgi:CDP-2,3-bis-(O-geranylgeranyl)-sn-glycerol synthase
MAPVVAHRLNFLPRLAKPIDGGYKFANNFIFGRTKTWRGLLLGIATAIFVGTIQFFLWQFNIIRVHSAVDFSVIDPIVFGFFGGIGALIGDLIKSFFKRRFGIASGQPWPVFDQLDFVIGYFAFTSILMQWNLRLFLAALVITLILHPLTNILAYFLSFKNVWW